LIDKECFAVTPQAAGYKSQGFAINEADSLWEEKGMSVQTMDDWLNEN
jgi:hypothetical protein